MDIIKSQRLSQYLGLISDLVQYEDIGAHMVEGGTLPPHEHAYLQEKLVKEGNASAMNEFLTMVNLRRGGFDQFIKVLRRTDYDWIAEQLDPGCAYSESSLVNKNARKSSKMQNLIGNVRQTINRKSEPITSVSRNSKSTEQVLTFMSYRDSCPLNSFDVMDAHPIPVPEKDNGCAKSHQERNIINDFPVETGINNEVATQLMSLDLNFKKLGKIAVVENVPGSVINESTTEYFMNLAKRLDVPEDLKVIRNNGKISKRYRRTKINNNVNLEFKTESARNLFIQSFDQFVLQLKPGDELYSTVKQLSVAVPKAKRRDQARPCKGLFSKSKLRKLEKSSIGETPTTPGCTGTSYCEKNSGSKAHWYQRRFSINSWKKKNA